MKKFMFGFAIVCHSGKDLPESTKHLNAILREKLIPYYAKEYDKETEKFKDVQHFITPKTISAPAITATDVCVMVAD